jgi:hypothetical protein
MLFVLWLTSYIKGNFLLNHNSKVPQSLGIRLCLHVAVTIGATLSPSTLKLLYYRRFLRDVKTMFVSFLLAHVLIPSIDGVVVKTLDSVTNINYRLKGRGQILKNL